MHACTIRSLGFVVVRWRSWCMNNVAKNIFLTLATRDHRPPLRVSGMICVVARKHDTHTHTQPIYIYNTYHNVIRKSSVVSCCANARASCAQVVVHVIAFWGWCRVVALWLYVCVYVKKLQLHQDCHFGLMNFEHNVVVVCWTLVTAAASS